MSMSSNDYNSSSSFQLEKILGLTTSSNSSIRSSNGSLFYISSNVVIKYCPIKNKQIYFYIVENSISCIDISEDGEYLIIGEYGLLPKISIYNLMRDELIIKFPSIHKHGIGCLLFSPNGNFIISTGYKIDRQLIIWNWKKGIKKIIYKLGNKVNNICFHSDGNSFITAGDRHLKWWYIQETSSTSGNAVAANLSLIGKPASILELFATSNFTDICYGQGKYSSFVYCITSTGLLCTFNHSSRLMEKWLQLKSAAAYSLSYSILAENDHILMIGCNNGIVLRYSPNSLELISSLPFATAIQSSHNLYNNLFPACYALCILSNSITNSIKGKIYYTATIYSDKSLIIWKTDLINKSDTIYRHFQYHRDTICDLKYINNISLPTESFVTISRDNSIRFWTVENGISGNNLINIFKINTSNEDAINLEISNGNTNVMLMNQIQLYDQVNKINKSNFPLSIHPYGYNLAFGAENGSINILDIESMKIKETLTNHTNNVISIDYTVCKAGVSTIGGLVNNEKILLASYDAENNINFFTQEQEPPVQFSRPQEQELFLTSRLHHIKSLDQLNDLSIEENKRNNNIIKFSANGTNFIISNNSDNSTKIIFNKIDENNNMNVIKSIQFKNNSIFGMCIDSTNKFVITTGKDKKINIWNISTGKLMRTYKNTVITNDLQQCVLDPAGMFIATYSNSDNNSKENNKNVVIYIIDFFSGDLITTIEDISCDLTTISFSPDGRCLLVTDINGCILVWKLPTILFIAITDRLNELNYISKDKYNYVSNTETEDGIIKYNSNIDDIEKIDEVIKEEYNFDEGINKDQNINDGKIKANRWQKNKDLDIYSSNQVKSGNLNKFTLELTRNLSFTMESNDNVIIYDEDIIDDDNYNDNTEDDLVQFSNIQEIELNQKSIVGSHGDLSLRKSINKINSLDASAQNLENWLEQMIQNEGGKKEEDDKDNDDTDDDCSVGNVNNDRGKFLLPPKQDNNIRVIGLNRIVENNNLIVNTSTSLPLHPRIEVATNNNSLFPPLPPSKAEEIVTQKNVGIINKYNNNGDDNGTDIDCINIQLADDYSDNGNDNITNGHISDDIDEDVYEESMNEMSLPINLSDSIHINKCKLPNCNKNNIDDKLIDFGNKDNYCNKSTTEELLQEKIKKCKNAFDELNKAKILALNSYEELILERDQISSSISQSISNENKFKNNNQNYKFKNNNQNLVLEGMDKSMNDINFNNVSLQLNQDHISEQLANVMMEAEAIIEIFKQDHLINRQSLDIMQTIQSPLYLNRSLLKTDNINITANESKDIVLSNEVINSILEKYSERMLEMISEKVSLKLANSQSSI